MQVGPTELVSSDADGNLATDGGAFDARVGANETAIAARDTQVGTNTSDIAALKDTASGAAGAATDNASAIAALQTSVGDNAGTLTNISNTLDDTDATLNTLQMALDDAIELIETPSDIDDVDEVTKAVADNATAINSVKSLADATETRVETVEAAVTTVETLAGDNQARVAAAEDEIVQVAAQATENQTRIARSEEAIADNVADIASNSAAITANTDGIAQLNTNFESLGFRVQNLEGQVARNDKDIDQNRAGIAIANALAGTSWLQANETHAVTGNWGYFDGTSAIAFTATQRLSKNWSMNGGIGVAPDDGEVGARAGFRLGW